MQVTTRDVHQEDMPAILACLTREEDRHAVRWRVTEGQGPNTVFVLDETLIAAGGLQLCHRGMADPWLVITPVGHKHFRALYRTIRAWLTAQIDAWQLHRVQAAVGVDDGKGQTLLRHLGFTDEGYMRQFTEAREDALLMAWVRVRSCRQ